MQINYIQNLVNNKICPVMKGRAFFSLNKKIDNKGLDNDCFQKTEDIVDIDKIKPQEKRETSVKTSLQDIFHLDEDSNETEQANKLIKTLEDNIDLTLEDKKNLFDKISEREYDISILMLIAARNSMSAKEDSYVYGDKIPKIFEGISKKEIADKLSEVINKVSWNFSHKNKEVGSFTLKDKKLYIQEIGSGFVGHVYKIFDEKGNKAAIKCYSTDMPHNNGLTEIATSRQMTIDKVNNVPEFYMGHSSDYFIEDNKSYNDKCWMLYEYIDKKTPVKKEGINWKQWCKKYELEHSDKKGSKQYVGKYLVDIGGITHNKYSDGIDYLRRYDYLRKSFKEGKTVKETLSELKDSI